MSINRSMLLMFALPKNALISDRCAAIGATIGVVHRKVGTKATMGQNPYWKYAISEAEKIAGNSAPFLNLQWLQNKEFAEVAFYLQTHARSSHPFLKNNSLIYNEKNKMQTYWGLVVFLISKAAGHLNTDDQKKDATGVLRSQMALAEVTEIIYNSYLIHKSVVNVQQKNKPKSSELKNINFGNKISVLSGDYLQAYCFTVLAKLKNHDLSELMSSTIRDLAESEFIGRRDNQNNRLPSVPPLDRKDYAIKEWTQMNELCVGSFLGKSCKGTLKLAKHSEVIQEQVYNFGKHLALAWQASRDLYPFIGKDRSNPFYLCSAPVMFHIERDPSILTEIDKGLASVSNVDYAKVYDIIISGPGIERTKQLQQEHSQRAMEVLNIFEESDARTALCNIVAASENFLQ